MHASARPYVIAGSAALLTSGMIAVMPAEQPAALRVANMDVRLVDSGSLLTDLTGALGNLDPLTSLGSLSLPDLGSLDLGGLDSSSLFADGSLLNIPYNLFADIVNIPYYESLALDEYAYALGPADSPGGVAGWIPTGTNPADIAPGDLYGVGGTGSWYMESLGNTWGWDDGNWPQLDALLHVLLPFSFTEDFANQIQIFAQSEFIDGAHIGCEFECANPLGYLLGWLHGQTSLESLFSGTTFPDTIQGIVGDPTFPVTWFGQSGAQLNLLEPLQAIATNLTASPISDPIQFPDLGEVFGNAEKLGEDFTNDFNPFVEGSFVYWGLPTDYSIPTAIGGTIQDFTGIPNQFGFPATQQLGSEPVSGLTSNPSDLPGYLTQGLGYLLNGNDGEAGNGLLGYLNPEIYLQALSNDFNLLTNPNDLLAALPLVGFLGLGNTDVFAPGSLLGTLGPAVTNGSASALPNAFDATGLLNSFDASSLLNSFDPASLLNSFDPASLLGGALDPTTLTTDLSALLPNAGADLASMLGGGLATDLSSLLSSSAVNVIPDLGLQLLTAI
jgi:hypothetical protein